MKPSNPIVRVRTSRGSNSATLIKLQTEIDAWSAKTNAKQRGVDWQFRIENARVKLSGSTQKSSLEDALEPDKP